MYPISYERKKPHHKEGRCDKDAYLTENMQPELCGALCDLASGKGKPLDEKYERNSNFCTYFCLKRTPLDAKVGNCNGC